MAGFRGLLYTLAKLMGDYNAVKKSKVGKRVGRRVAGKATGKAIRYLNSFRMALPATRRPTRLPTLPFFTAL